MRTYHNTAISFGNLKESLLYFEYIIPMNISGIAMGLRPATAEPGLTVERFKEISMDGHRELKASFGEPEDIVKLFPPQLARNPQFAKFRNMFEHLLFIYMIKVTEGQEIFEKYIRELAKVVGTQQAAASDLFCPTTEDLRNLFISITAKFQLQTVPVDSSFFVMGPSTGDDFSNCLSVPDIRVIDTTKVMLPHIMEFRKDKKAMSSMRNFRLFAYQQYDGKDKAFIEDDIQRRLEDYYATVKASGFETTAKTLSFLFESKSLGGACIASAASAFMGNYLLAAGAFGTGAIFEMGKLSLEYTRQRNELKKICRENPISYIADAKKALEK